MSDGPHRSLPLKRPWKVLAERAAREAYPVTEVGEAVAYALKKEFLEAPLEEICQILDGKGQRNLFSDNQIESLESLRDSNYGSSASCYLIDCALDAVINGHTGRTAQIFVLKNALAGYLLSANRSIEEHFLRKAGDQNADFVRNRLNAAYRECDFINIAADMIKAGKSSSAAIRLPRNIGIDAGPPL